MVRHVVGEDLGVYHVTLTLLACLVHGLWEERSAGHNSGEERWGDSLLPQLPHPTPSFRTEDPEPLEMAASKPVQCYCYMAK